MQDLRCSSLDWQPTSKTVGATGKRELGHDCIDIWFCPLDAFGSEQLPLSSLSDDEIARYRRISNRDAALQYLAGRVMTRSALSSYSGVPEREWRFKTHRYGRPAIADPAAHRALNYNLSHTNAAAVLAVGELEQFGIDIESHERQVEIEEIGWSVFTAAERSWISGTTAKDTLHRFFDLWTMKESYMKARGLGFSLQPKSFELIKTDGRWKLGQAPACELEPSEWQFIQMSPRADLTVALAVKSRNHVRIRRLKFDPVDGSVGQV